MWVALGSIATTAMFGVQFVLFLRWLHRRMRDDEIVRECVRDVAKNHLPHIYSVLRLVAKKQGVYLDDPPPVKFISFNNGKYKP